MYAVDPGTGHRHAHKKPHGKLSMACRTWVAPGTVIAGGSGSLQGHRRVLTGSQPCLLGNFAQPSWREAGDITTAWATGRPVKWTPHQKFTTVQVKLQLAKKGQSLGEHCEVAVKSRVLEMK